MKYSEAIRLGSMLKPQGFGVGRDRDLTACANDAAILAIGRDSYLKFFQDFPLADTPGRSCPVCLILCLHLGGNVAHLNDGHRWTRERIADWVETIERAQEASAERSAELVTHD